jgi:hypothetical protein
MATDISKRVFISYSRKDVKFVDDLEAELISRGFFPWVDRRQLEGGQDWLDTIQHAIDTTSKVVVALSPDAVISDFVKIEYRYGRSKGKPIIPILVKPCDEVPIDLNHIHWVTSFIENFETGLNDLLVALAREDRQPDRLAPANPLLGDPAGTGEPEPAATELPMSEDALYLAGLDAFRKGDLELAAIYWQRLLDVASNYLEGEVAKNMEDIRFELAPARAQRLCDEAYRAHDAGDWDKEIATWESYLKLYGDDQTVQAEKANAEKNREPESGRLYTLTKAFTDRGDYDDARQRLAQLWARAPYYGDPDGIAPRLGLTPPFTYREKKRRDDEQAAQEAARRAEKKRQADELAAQEAARRAEEARRRAEIAAAEAARQAEEKRLADEAAAKAMAIQAEKNRVADALAAEEAQRAEIARKKAADKAAAQKKAAQERAEEAKRRQDLREWKRENRAPYREKVSGYGSSGFAIWLSALLVMVGAVFFVLPALRTPPVAALVRTNIPQANLFPEDLIPAALATVIAAALVYAIGYWRALNIGVFLLAAICAAPLAWLASLAWQGASQKLTSYTVPFIGRQVAGDWWQFPFHHGIVWAIIFTIVGSLGAGIFGLAVGSDSDNAGLGCILGFLGGVIGGALIGMSWGFIIAVSVPLLGWGYGGLVTGATVGALAYLITMFVDEDDAPPDSVLLAALVVATAVALIQWAMWAWGFGISSPAFWSWALSLLIAILVGGALILSLRIMFTRRDPIPQEFRKVASK